MFFDSLYLKTSMVFVALRTLLDCNATQQEQSNRMNVAY